MTTKNQKPVRVGISVGDLNGIGIEIILKTLEDKRILSLCTPIIFGSSRTISYHKKTINSNIPIQVTRFDKVIVDEKINVINVWNEELPFQIGTPTDVSGQYAFKSLRAATNSLKNKQVDFLLTAPVNKRNIQIDGFNFTGHTGYLENQLKQEALMILVSETLRVGLVTEHLPLSEVSKNITQDLLAKKIDIMYRTLQQDFAVTRPKIAVLGLNPHCGDGGITGDEDEVIIRPVLQKMQGEGRIIYGPYAADGFFGAENYTNFDAVLAMYHDQGLIPFKMLSFGRGVNFTAGLSGIRTSPDHGTAFDIAGKNKANPSSFRQALFTGIDIFRNRLLHKEVTQNPLNVSE